MRHTLFASWISVLALACTPGPHLRQFYRGEAVSLDLHVNDLPTPGPGGALTAGLSIELVPYCQPLTADPAGSFDSRVTPSSGGSESFDPTSGHLLARLHSSLEIGLPCSNGTRGPRFFRPQVFVYQGAAPVGMWTGTQDLVYAEQPTELWLFGPSGPRAQLPVGYSLLHESCAPGAGITLTVEPVSTVIEVRRASPEPGGLTSRGRVELAQRRLLESCGITPPAAHLENRVGLDAPLRLAWSADGTRLYYLVPVDLDPAASQGWVANLRAIPPQGGAVIALASGLRPNALTVVASGDLYLSGEETPLRGRPQADGTVKLEAVLEENAVPSPDGRWLALSERRAGEPMTVVVDLTSGVRRDVDAGWPLAWSPDSQRLAFRKPAASAAEWGVMQIWNPGTGQIVPTGNGVEPMWLPDGKLVLRTFDPTALGERMDAFSADGAPLGQSHFDGRGGVPFWAGDHLAELIAAPWVVRMVGPLDNDYPTFAAGPLDLQDAAHGYRALLPADELLPGWGAPPNPSTAAPAPAALYGSATPFALSWTRKCLGFYETLCTYQLHRIALPDGADATVAMSAEAPLAFAVSPDQRQLAVGTSSGIFVLPLP
jgi:hypothetical protein